MMSFFRAYQKVFFVIVSALVMISFFFFGPMSGNGVKEPVKEHPLVKGIDGSTITIEKVERLANFLSSSQQDLLDDKAPFSNWLNDGVLEKDFFGTTLGIALAEKIFPSIEMEIQQTLQKAKSFKMYRHPRIQTLHAEVLWSQFAPGAIHSANLLVQTQQKASLHTFHQFIELYKAQKELPLLFCKRMMLYQEKQEAKIEPDSELPYADLSLLGLHTAGEWFGKKYLKAAAQVVINGAIKAKELGLSVSIQEVRQDLLLHVQDAARRSGEKVEPSQLYGVFLGQVRKAGMEERECLDLWKDVMLFRKLVASFAEKAVIDPTVLQAAQEAAKEEVVIDLYSLPPNLRSKDFLSMLKRQMYIDAISCEGTDSLVFPTEIAPIHEIERKMPELVRKEYVLEYAELDVEKAALQIGVKETWDWEVGEGWSLVAKEFSSLSQALMTKEDRLAKLMSLEEEERFAIDTFARKKMVISSAARVEAALSALETKQDTCLVSSKGEGLPFKNIKDLKALYQLIEAKETAKLASYSQDGQHYYKIHVVEAPESARVLTLQEADSLGILRQKLDQKLEALYITARKKESSSYQQQDGSWKPLAEVKERVGLLLFPTLIQRIQAEYTKVTGQAPTFEQKQSPSFYAEQQMNALARAALASCQKKEESFNDKSPLLAQWDLVKERQTKKKKEFSAFPHEFSLPPGSFSEVHLTGLGKGVFFQMIEKKETDGLSSEEIRTLRAPEERSAIKKGITELVDTIFTKQALSLEDVL